MNNLLSSDNVQKAAIAAALYAAYRFAPHPALKTAAVAVGAVLVAKQLPVLSDALA